ncbi:MAG: single-stranded DNA-binding protein [Alphaproteobacteria bacterium]|nr:single-stranded DNA-binding protein [Alphaproteobacteria bacterium]
MSGVNKVILIGNVGHTPEIKTTESGNKIASFSIATSETWKDKATGERKEATEWHKVAIFNQGVVKVVEQFVKKGTKLYLSGKLKTRKYTGKDGIERSVTEIVIGAFDGELVLLDGKDKAGAIPSASENDYDGKTTGADYTRAKNGEMPPAADYPFNDDIPF